MLFFIGGSGIIFCFYKKNFPEQNILYKKNTVFVFFFICNLTITVVDVQFSMVDCGSGITMTSQWPVAKHHKFT